MPPTALEYFDPKETLFISCDFGELSFNQTRMLRGEGSMRFTGFSNPALVRGMNLEVWPDGSFQFTLSNIGSNNLQLP